MPKLFDDLRERLLRAGVGPRHVRRYLAELKDHLDEAERRGNDHAAALARLGSTEDLAKPMLERPEFRSWTARAPWAVMVLGPFLSMIMALIALTLMFIGFALTYRWVAPWPGIVEPMPLQSFAHAVTAFAVLILPLMIGWFAAGVAVQQRLRPLWPLLGLALFAVISGTFGLEVTFPKTLGEPGELTLGFNWMDGEFHMDVSPLRWVLNLALLVGPYVAWRFKRDTGVREERDVGNAEKAHG